VKLSEVGFGYKLNLGFCSLSAKPKEEVVKLPNILFPLRVGEYPPTL
jgi:hypothetical protein